MDHVDGFSQEALQMNRCPLKIGQIVFEIHKNRSKSPAKHDMPVLQGWTVVDITDESDGWFAIVSHTFEGEKHPQTRTIASQLWSSVYHATTAHAVQHELDERRNMIAELHSIIDAEKHYLYQIESIGIMINNNNKQGNPLNINIF